MRFYPCVIFIAVASGLLLSCQRANQPGESENTLPPGGFIGRSHPLAEKAKAVPNGKAQIELTRSKPAGPAGEEAEFEWTILTQVATPSVKMPEGIGRPGDNWWVVYQLTLKASFDKSVDDVSIDKSGSKTSKPGCRHMALWQKHDSVNPVAAQSSNSYVRPGTKMTLEISTYPGPQLTGSFFGVQKQRDLLEVVTKPLDDLVKPLLRGPELIDFKQPLKLMQVDDQITTLEIVP